MARPDERIMEAFASIPSAVFVETGTSHGGGVKAALEVGFTRVVSIEPVTEYYEECFEKFRKKIKQKKVKLIHGASEDHLAAAISCIDSPIVYWLDGHLQSIDSDASHCPLAEEVKAILDKKIGDSDVVMVDDIRMLKRQRAWQGHQVNIRNVLGELVLAAPNHMSLFLRGYQQADVFVLMPRWLLSQYCHLFDRQV